MLNSTSFQPPNSRFKSSLFLKNFTMQFDFYLIHSGEEYPGVCFLSQFDFSRGKNDSANNLFREVKLGKILLAIIQSQYRIIGYRGMRLPKEKSMDNNISFDGNKLKRDTSVGINMVNSS